MFGVALVLAIAFASAASGGAPASQDFGDAPDGRGQNKFPSLLANDGARAADSSVAVLGSGATIELNSAQVNKDKLDDDVRIHRLQSCRTSELRVTVTMPAFVQPALANAYLNVFFDWDRSGNWLGTENAGGKKNKPRE